MSDALSHLKKIKNVIQISDSDNVLDELTEIYMTEMYHISLVELSLKFCESLLYKYEKNSALFRIINILKITAKHNDNEKDSDEDYIKSEINYIYQNELLHHTERMKKWLVISAELRKKVFCLVYDRSSHVRLHRCYQWIVNAVYIHWLTHYLKLYLQHYSIC